MSVTSSWVGRGYFGLNAVTIGSKTFSSALMEPSSGRKYEAFADRVDSMI